jgi:K+-transporting ATPase A subunit
MGELAGFLMMIFFLIIAIVVTRLLGAWMLRINDVINIQRETLLELIRIRKVLNNIDHSNQSDTKEY